MPFHIVLFFPNNPAPHYWWRESEKPMPDGGLAPEFSPSVQDAKFKVLHRVEDAVARRDLFRKYFPGYRIVIRRTDGSTEDQFEDRSAEVARTAAPVERQNMQCGGILIVPASLNRWAIRFPQSNFESIYAATPTEAYQGYLRAIALRPEMAQHAERYTPPEMTDEQFIAQLHDAQRAVQQAAFPGRRRPGNH